MTQVGQSVQHRPQGPQHRHPHGDCEQGTPRLPRDERGDRSGDELDVCAREIHGAFRPYDRGGGKRCQHSRRHEPERAPDGRGDFPASIERDDRKANRIGHQTHPENDPPVPHHRTASSASAPKPAIIAPDTRFTHRSPAVDRARLNAPATPLRMSHHSAEPLNTPATSARALAYPARAVIPSPAKIAANERIVIGFVSVNRSVDPYDPSTPRLPAGGDPATGMARRVRMPREHRNNPPASRSHDCPPVSTAEIAVSPNAATEP